MILFFSISFVFASVDINSATLKELLNLNGIGKAKAQKIIEYKKEHGCFKSIDELANIEGISKKLVFKNRADLTVGVCRKIAVKDSRNFLLNTLLDPVNMIFTVIILVLGMLDLITNKEFKSQIVSAGVLGTFVGIFIGLQGFNPDDIVNSVNGILAGLKTAFFTSILGMSVALILSTMQTLRSDSESK